MLRRQFLASLPFAGASALPDSKLNGEEKQYREVYRAEGNDWISVKWADVKPGDEIMVTLCDAGDVGRGGWGGKLRGWEYFKVLTIEPGVDGKVAVDGELRHYHGLPMTPTTRGAFNRLVLIPDELLKRRKVAILKLPYTAEFPLLPLYMMHQSSSPHLWFQESAMAHRIVSEKFPAIEPAGSIPIFNSVQELEDYAEGK